VKGLDSSCPAESNCSRESRSDAPAGTSIPGLVRRLALQPVEGAHIQWRPTVSGCWSRSRIADGGYTATTSCARWTR
jgi:hypothetical protein